MVKSIPSCRGVGRGETPCNWRRGRYRGKHEVIGPATVTGQAYSLIPRTSFWVELFDNEYP